MLVLGIDPGIAITGFGLIQNDRQNELACVGYGVINTPANLDEGQRLVQIYQALVDLIQHHQPQSSAVEKLFFQKNVRTALSVGQARGVVMLTLAQAGCPVKEYTPNEVKQAVCGYGNADKKQVQRMVQTLLQLDDIPKPDDAADALAIAICHIYHQSFSNLVEQTS
ncbi:MAG: crossover junction endodeoxyribonuclease RuvC [Brevefilum sp.]|jgi:crossover junction endodeoxyribonuclease RuvC